MPMRRAYHVKDLIDMPKDQLWQLPEGGLALTFQNGERHVYPTFKTIYSAYFWQLFREFPGGVITPSQHLGNGVFESGSHVNLATRILWPVYIGHCPDFRFSQHPDIFWTLSRRIYEITNEVFNDMTSMCGEWVTGFDIEDILDIEDIPELQAVKHNPNLTVQEKHDQGYTAVMNSGLRNTTIRGLETGTLNKLQAKQVLITRAFIPDINGNTCEFPIEPAYADGIDTLYDRLFESRGASISIYMQHAPLEISEYNNRMCQFLTGIVEGIKGHDCGGEHALNWTVLERDLKTLPGKIYEDPKTKELKMFTGKETELIGKKVRIRSILTCDNYDPTCPCPICAGISATLLPPGTNYGHYMSVEPLARASQQILGTKHVIGSIAADYLSISGIDLKYIHPHPEDKLQICLNKRTSGEGDGKWSLQIQREDARFINDIYSVDRITDLKAEAITRIQRIELVQELPNGSRKVRAIDTLVSGKGMHLTREFLDYMRTQELSVIGNEWISIPLKNWESEIPFLFTGRRSVDIMDIIVKLKSFLHSPEKSSNPRCMDYTSVEGAMRELLDLFTAHIHVNFAQVEVFVRGLMAAGDYSYCLPRGGEPFRFLKLKDAIKNRSLGAALAFEGVKDLILKSPGSYTHNPEEIPPGHRLDYVP